jgi:hypothetical protein
MLINKAAFFHQKKVEVEAYVLAKLQGHPLIAQWSGKPTYVELDCPNLIHDLAKEVDNRSAWNGVLQEI